MSKSFNKPAVQKNKHLTPLVLIGSVCLLTACGGGGGSSSASNSVASTPFTLQGVVSKGILQNAIITAYSVDSSGKKGSPIGSPVRTSTTGQYSLKVTGVTGPVVVEETVDATTLETCDTAGGCGSVAFGNTFTPPASLVMDTVIGSVSPSTTTINAQITPFTQLATTLAENTSGGLTSSNITQSLTQVATVFGLQDLNSTIPADITATNVGKAPTDSQQYAVMNAAIATLAAQSNSTPQAIIQNLGNQLITQQGIVNTTGSTLVTASSASIPTLANLYSASLAVTQAAGLTNSQVSNALTTAMTTANNQNIGSLSTVNITPATSPLTIAKNFINNLHIFLQTALTLDNSGNIAALATAYQPVTTLLQSNSAEMSQLMKATETLGGFLLNEAQVAHNGGTLTTTDLLNFIYNSNNYTYSLLRTGSNGSSSYPLIIQPNADFAITSTTTGSASPSVILNGSINVQPGYWSWGYWSSGTPCNTSTSTSTSTNNCLIPVPNTTPITIKLNNIAVTYPASAGTAQTSDTIQLMPGGTLSSPNISLAFGNSGGSLTLNYNNATAVNPLRLGSAQLTGTNAPDSATLSLTNATITEAKSVFTGNVSIAAQKINEPVVDTNNITTIPALIPTTLSINGTLNTGVNQDNIAVTATASLDQPNTQNNLVQVIPGDGYKNSALLNYQYFPGSASTQTQEYAALTVNPGITLAPWSGIFNTFNNTASATPPAVYLVNAPATSNEAMMYCNSGSSTTTTSSTSSSGPQNALFMLTGANSGGVWPYSGGPLNNNYQMTLIDCNSSTTLSAALAGISANSSSSPYYYNNNNNTLQTTTTTYNFLSWFTSAGANLSSTTPVPVTATVAQSYGGLARGSAPGIENISASISASVTLGGAVHTVKLNVSGDRTGLKTGDATINLTLDALPMLTIVEPNFQASHANVGNILLSDSSGAAVSLPLSAFSSASSGKLSVPVQVGTTTQGTLSKGAITTSNNFANAYLVTFTDNSIVAL